MRIPAAIVLFLSVFCSPVHAESLRVALLLEHDQDSAWTGLLRSGLDAARKPGVETEVIIAAPGSAQRDIFRAAAANHDLVLVASDSLHEALRDNAASFRRVKFGSIDAGIRAPNIMSVTFADEQASFLAGAAAAMQAGDTGIIGWLSGQDTPAMRSLFNGYSEGALLARPGTRIIQAVAGSFTDPQAAAQKATWLMDSGAKAIALAAGAGNAAAAAAVRARSIPVIELDSPTGAPALGVIVKAADQAVRDIVEAAAQGTFRGKKITVYNLANRGVDFKYAGLKPDTARRIGELRNEIQKGAIRINSLRQRTLCDCLD